MKKSIKSKEYRIFLTTLYSARISKGITQKELSILLGENQSFVSKIENGERRVDLIELRTILGVMNIDLYEFIGKMEQSINESRHKI